MSNRLPAALRHKFQNPNHVGSSEYRAVYDTLREGGAIDDTRRVRPRRAELVDSVFVSYEATAKEMREAMLTALVQGG
jgi:hypothetical protein